jgi:hypothetical protein
MSPAASPCATTIFARLEADGPGGIFFRLNRADCVDSASCRAIFLNETAFALAPPAPIRNCPAHD